MPAFFTVFTFLNISMQFLSQETIFIYRLQWVNFRVQLYENYKDINTLYTAVGICDFHVG